uniref:TF-B3 domain-containing protein n=1 Tax=Chenopodium quinoa TaxID=63459 RepID=A0A803LWB4_CHEQI
MVVIFVKELKQTDIEHRLSWPTESLGHLPTFNGGNRVNFEVVDDTGRSWPFRCSIRRTGPYAKPVITSGWLDFVRANNLESGDTIIFYKDQVPDRQPTYRVRVFPKGAPVPTIFLFGYLVV